MGCAGVGAGADAGAGVELCFLCLGRQALERCFFIVYVMGVVLTVSRCSEGLYLPRPVVLGMTELEGTNVGY